jgi:hypothetical protein
MYFEVVYELPNGLLVDNTLETCFNEGKTFLQLCEYLLATVVTDDRSEKDFFAYYVTLLKKIEKNNESN